MGRTNFNASRAGFIADHHSIVRNNGRQIDWANVSASYVDATTGKKVLPAGTVVGDLLSGTGKVSPRVVTSNPAIGILETAAVEDEKSAAVSGYGIIIGGAVYETLLPDSSGSPRVLDPTIKSELNAAGTGFAFLAYSDARS